MGIFDIFKKKDRFYPVAQPEATTARSVARLMTKDEIELILIKIMIKGEEALLIKVYKNGTIVRNGAGGVPRVEVGCMNEGRDQQIWNKLLDQLPPSLLELNGQQIADDIRDPYSYTVVFYGQSSNGQTGEYADWQRTQGMHIEADLNGPNHPFLPAMDKLAMAAVMLTNPWYFDIVVLACFGMKAEGLGGILSTSRTFDKEQAFAALLTQLSQSPAAADVAKYPVGKVYVEDGTAHRFRLEMKLDGQNARYDFIPTI
jgi:hypothetical protein